MKIIIIVLFTVIINLTSNVIARHNSQGRVGSNAQIEILQAKVGQPTIFEVYTDPNITKTSEMMFYGFPPEGRGNAAIIRRIVPATKLGYYHLEITFPRQGKWDVSFRYGIGLDLYYAGMDIYIDNSSYASKSYEQSFRGDLGQKVPRFIQPLGFSILGFVFAIMLSLAIVILSRLKTYRNAF